MDPLDPIRTDISNYQNRASDALSMSEIRKKITNIVDQSLNKLNSVDPSELKKVIDLANKAKREKYSKDFLITRIFKKCINCLSESQWNKMSQRVEVIIRENVNSSSAILDSINISIKKIEEMVGKAVESCEISCLENRLPIVNKKINQRILEINAKLNDLNKISSSSGSLDKVEHEILLLLSEITNLTDEVEQLVPLRSVTILEKIIKEAKNLGVDTSEAEEALSEITNTMKALDSVPLLVSEDAANEGSIHVMNKLKEELIQVGESANELKGRLELPRKKNEVLVKVHELVQNVSSLIEQKRSLELNLSSLPLNRDIVESLQIERSQMKAANDELDETLNEIKKKVSDLNNISSDSFEELKEKIDGLVDKTKFYIASLDHNMELVQEGIDQYNEVTTSIGSIDTDPASESLDKNCKMLFEQLDELGVSKNEYSHLVRQNGLEENRRRIKRTLKSIESLCNKLGFKYESSLENKINGYIGLRKAEFDRAAINNEESILKLRQEIIDEVSGYLKTTRVHVSKEAIDDSLRLKLSENIGVLLGNLENLHTGSSEVKDSLDAAIQEIGRIFSELPETLQPLLEKLVLNPILALVPSEEAPDELKMSEEQFKREASLVKRKLQFFLSYLPPISPEDLVKTKLTPALIQGFEKISVLLEKGPLPKKEIEFLLSKIMEPVVKVEVEEQEVPVSEEFRFTVEDHVKMVRGFIVDPNTIKNPKNKIEVFLGILRGKSS